jgi:hypothetical protein
MAGAELVTSLPFAGTLAWTSLGLAASARYVRARTLASRLLWAGLVAVLWGQLAAAHFSVGLLIGTTVVASYLLAVGARNVRTKAWTVGEAIGMGLLLLPAAVLLNAAFLLPRLAYLPETNLSLGYGRLEQLARELAGLPALPRRIGAAAAPPWPLNLASAPAAHLGAVTLAMSGAAFWSRGRRHLVFAFAVAGVLAYLLSLRAVATWILSVAPEWRVADFYLRRPEWMGYGVVLVLAILGALGLDTWLREPSGRRRALMAAPGVVVWGLLPLGFGAGVRLTLLALAAAATAPVLLAAGKRAALVAIIPAVLAIELVANGLMGYRPLPFLPAPVLLVQLPTPTLRMSSYLRPGPIARALQRLPVGRAIDLDLPGWRRLLADPLSPVFRTEQAQGYNPVALKRYWFFVRAVTPVVLDHNLSVFSRPPPVALDLLNVRYVAAPTWPYPTPSRGPLAAEGPGRLFEGTTSPPRTSVVTNWRVVPGFDAALREVTRNGFDPGSTVVLESDPGLGPPASPERGPTAGRAEYRSLGQQEARVTVETAGPALVLIRTPYAPGWHATVDGRAVPVLPADFVAMAVPIARGGRHTIDLSYDDPAIGYGLAVSAIGLALLVGAILLAARRGRPSGSPIYDVAAPGEEVDVSKHRSDAHEAR